jgi:hypothetical protein
MLPTFSPSKLDTGVLNADAFPIVSFPSLAALMMFAPVVFRFVTFSALISLRYAPKWIVRTSATRIEMKMRLTTLPISINSYFDSKNDKTNIRPRGLV